MKFVMAATTIMRAAMAMPVIMTARMAVRMSGDDGDGNDIFLHEPRDHCGDHCGESVDDGGGCSDDYGDHRFLNAGANRDVDDVNGGGDADDNCC